MTHAREHHVLHNAETKQDTHECMEMEIYLQVQLFYNLTWTSYGALDYEFVLANFLEHLIV